jgi:leucyl/phenylalanyl-tRNA--protein transferase
LPVFALDERHEFPPARLAGHGGLLAVGGDLDPERVLLAYRSGIFPWYSEDQPILWFSPNPRFVLRPDTFRVQRSLKKRVRRGDFEVRLDTAFAEVIDGCRDRQRPGQTGTWITDELRASCLALHAQGYAHSAEAWRDGKLVGGLYGIGIGQFFSGESMFAEEPDASKVAFVWLAQQLFAWGFGLIDCQVHTEHLARFGAADLGRRAYLAGLPALIEGPHRPGPWSFDPGFTPQFSAENDAP